MSSGAQVGSCNSLNRKFLLQFFETLSAKNKIGLSLTDLQEVFTGNLCINADKLARIDYPDQETDDNYTSAQKDPQITKEVTQVCPYGLSSETVGEQFIISFAELLKVDMIYPFYNKFYKM